MDDNERVRRVLRLIVRLGVWKYMMPREIAIVATFGGNDKIIAEARARGFQQVQASLPPILASVSA